MKKIMWLADFYDGEDTNWLVFAEKDNYFDAKNTFLEVYKQDFGCDFDTDDYFEVNAIREVGDTTDKLYSVILK